MNTEEIKSKFTEILRDVLDNDSLEVTRETTAANYPDWDSLAHINIIVATESQFGIKFNLDELKSFRTVGDMLDMIETKTINR